MRKHENDIGSTLTVIGICVLLAIVPLSIVALVWVVMQA
jgi:hypothetical protein